MTETELLENLKKKIQNKNYEKIMDRIIYLFFQNKKDKTWDLNNVNLIGMGAMVNSNYFVMAEDEKYGFSSKLNETHQFLILRNTKTNKVNIMVLQPIDKANSDEVNILEWGYPCFDEIEGHGATNKSFWICTNALDECIELAPRGVKKPIPFASLLTKKQIALNNTIVKLIPKELPPLSSLSSKNTKKK